MLLTPFLNQGCTLVDVSWLHQFQPDYFRTHRIK